MEKKGAAGWRQSPDKGAIERVREWGERQECVGIFTVEFFKVSGESRVSCVLSAGMFETDKFGSEHVTEPFKVTMRVGEAWGEVQHLMCSLLLQWCKEKTEVHARGVGKPSPSVQAALNATLDKYDLSEGGPDGEQ